MNMVAVATTTLTRYWKICCSNNLNPGKLINSTTNCHSRDYISSLEVAASIGILHRSLPLVGRFLLANKVSNNFHWDPTQTASPCWTYPAGEREFGINLRRLARRPALSSSAPYVAPMHGRARGRTSPAISSVVSSSPTRTNSLLIL